MPLLLLYYVGREWSSRYFGKLLELFTEGVEDYRNSQNETKNPVDKACDKSAENKPEKVAKEACTKIGINRFAHRPHIEFRYLKALFSERNSYNSYAPDNSRKEPKCSADTAKGEEP